MNVPRVVLDAVAGLSNLLVLKTIPEGAATQCYVATNPALAAVSDTAPPNEARGRRGRRKAGAIRQSQGGRTGAGEGGAVRQGENRGAGGRKAGSLPQAEARREIASAAFDGP